jgi:hypothetical protein
MANITAFCAGASDQRSDLGQYFTLYSYCEVKCKIRYNKRNSNIEKL